MKCGYHMFPYDYACMICRLNFNRLDSSFERLLTCLERRSHRDLCTDHLENPDVGDGERITGAHDTVLHVMSARYASLLLMWMCVIRAHDVLIGWVAHVFGKVVVVLSGSMEPAFYRGASNMMYKVYD